MKGITNSLIQWYVRKRVKQMQFFFENPIDIQKNVLSKLLKAAKDTEYGKKYKFNDIISYREFKDQVPLVYYEDFEPYITRSRKGEKNLIWPGSIEWYAKSSGTTNAKSKFIPITKSSLNDCHYKAGKDLFSIYAYNNPETKIFNCKNLRLGGTREDYEDFNSKYGDLSAVLIDNLPFWAEWKSTPNKQVSLLKDWEIKMPAIINQVVNQNVGSLTGVPSWMMVLLRNILENNHIKYIDEIWPNLECFFHGGISFTPYVEQYKNIFKKSINYYEIYNASEGYFAMQDTNSSKDMILMLDYGIFYEFIPMDEFYSENPTIVCLEDIQLNINYALVISTNGGLWRYIIGDTVRFVSKKPYRIKVTGRTKFYINAFGEELMVENAEQALKVAQDKTKAIISEYTAGPVFMDGKEKGAHEWVIEFECQPDSMEEFTRILDLELQKLNSDYEAKRYNNMTLNPPKVHSAKKNLFYEWMKLRGKLGGQNKIPRLANDREYLNALLEMNNEL
ncbi:GH3 auxin-responsive promoter family protein [Apibacter muscae]|uniref:GH3 auxin-responsive promoter family protein n=1 Tax=Apibacter muscae TaxID=2509004 RepID=A0A563D7N1_9FLAO|nr:GH3 auxin-responsive promoter family protein [Apibacter muscae]TWP26190.1 GH3 auxin-responsive promoter family protein [Apibacter muscae]